MPDAPPPQTTIRFSRWDPPTRQISTPGLSATLFGDCLSSDQTVADAIVTNTTPAQAVRALVHLPGRFGVTVRDGDGIAVAGDLAGTIRWWWTRHNGTIQLALSPLPLAQLTGSQVNPLAVAANLFLPDAAPDLSDESIYHGVRELSPSRILVISGEHATTERRPDPSPIPVRDAPEALAEALATSVRAHTAGAAAVSADLSGGLDSSTLALLAARTTDTPITALTYTDSYSANDDDAGYALALAKDEPGLTHQVLTGGPEELPFTDLFGAPVTDLSSLDVLLYARTRFRLAPVAGTSVHLVGGGGDVVLGAPITYLADAARLAGARRFISECTGWARLRHRPVHRLVRAALVASRTSYRAALEHAATELDTPPRARRAEHVPRFESSVAWVHVSKSARWATPSARAQVAEALRAGRPGDDQDGADAHTLRLIRWHGSVTRSFLHVADHLGVPIAAPFFDSDVLAACLSVPAWQRATVHQAKPLLRQAFTGRLPNDLFIRRTKGDYSACEYHGLRANAGAVRALLTDSRLADLDIIDAAAVRADLDAAISGARAPMGALSQVLATEVWLRQLETYTGEA
ncbi:albusnodin/ikarugamycin family macrolactam cyclase [Nocardiopsis sp. CA-288880]|uniref:albusnodin/ikarugamycin family macrolactam cyclase n=1 Tax=Nocardiopsis sp. CA-288880 TaxID=3239995 RepID=UPI003D977EDA